MKWILRLFMLGIVVAFLIGFVSWLDWKAGQPPDAPYGLQAYYQDAEGNKIPTRIYYADKIEIIGGDAELTTYWTYDGDKYQKHSGTKIVPPPFTIIRRGESG